MDNWLAIWDKKKIQQAPTQKSDVLGRKTLTNTAKDIVSLIAYDAEACLKKQGHTKQNSEQHAPRWSMLPACFPGQQHIP